MAAPDYAITLYKEAKTEFGEEGPGADFLEMLEAGASCVCGWRGKVGDLLCDQHREDPPPNDFWCPQCRTRGWSFD